MPLNLTHNQFGDYTPLARTPSKFWSHKKSTGTHLQFGLDELNDRPHFGVEDIRTTQNDAKRSVDPNIDSFTLINGPKP